MRPAPAIAPAVGTLLCVATLCACPPANPGGPDAGQDAGPDPAILTPNESGWWRDVVFYEVFVRSWLDTDADGTGDLAGVTAKLDVLNDADGGTETDLGVGGIWLMPIFASDSYHGYDVTDYEAVEQDYGTQQDLDALITAAHARGIKVVVDLVINHTSANHPWFQDAKSGPGAAHRDWYVWRDTQPTGWKQPFAPYSTAVWHFSSGDWYYGLYGSGMPDLNWRNPAVEAEFVRIMKLWLARGVDGFRLDAVRYLVEHEDATNADVPETHEVLQRLRHAVHLEYPDALFVGEAWTSTQKIAPYYGEGNELPLAFSFDVARATWTSARDGTALNVRQSVGMALGAVPDPGYWAPFLTNHDQVRVMRELSGAGDKARLAIATLMAQPGTPFLYYGEELGMQGGPLARDEDKRTPMRWTSGTHGGFTTASNSWYSARFGNAAPENAGVDVETQQADPGSLWHLYRRLITLRNGSAALSAGAAARPELTGGPADAVWALLRTAPSGERVLFVANFAAAATGPFTVAVSGTPTTLESEGLSAPPSPQSGALSFADLAPRSFVFIRLD